MKINYYITDLCIYSTFYHYILVYFSYLLKKFAVKQCHFMPIAVMPLQHHLIASFFLVLDLL